MVHPQINLWGIAAQLWSGLGYTLLVTLCCGAAGLATGLMIACLRRIGFRWLNPFLDLYVYVFRGVPVLVLLFIVYFGLPGLGVTVPPLLAMVLSLGLISGAYLSEVFRGALNSVESTEILAATAMGFTRLEIFKSIELPQMFRFAFPGMVNELTTVLKYSPFAYTVGIPEITKQAMTLSATTLRGVEIYLVVGILYFSIFRAMLFVMRSLEKLYRIPGLILNS